MFEIILIPFLGTALGAATVFFFKKAIGEKMQRALTGFASGVMVAASFFSLLLKAGICSRIHRIRHRNVISSCA